MIFTRLQRFNRGGVSPFHRMVTLRDELDNLFQQALGRPLETPFHPDASGLPEGGLPALDLYEDKDSWVVKVELPGLKKEDIAISLEDGALTVSGERKQNPKHDAATVCRCERVLGRFERSIGLPGNVDAGKSKAAYTDGVLTVTLPKSEEAKPKQIPINIK
jgi:HSP20 family protein